MKNSRLSSLLALLPAALFAVMLLCSVSAAASAFSRISHRDDTSYTLRTAAGFISTKLALRPSENPPDIEPFGSCTALCISEEYGKERYITRIYCYNGSLCELFTPDIEGFSPEDGQETVRLDSLEFSLENGLLRIVLTLENDSLELFFDAERGTGQ